MEDAPQVSIHFPGGNTSSGKTEKTSNIFGTIKQILLRFHQNDRTLSGHLTLVTDDVEHVAQCQNL